MTTALITGASGGIGAAFAQKLAERQTNLILVARSEPKLQQLKQQLQDQYKIRVDFLVQDLMAPAAAKTVFDAVTQKGLTIDLFINMSSTAAFQPMPYFSVYAASKAFVLSFSEALWAENRSYGVRVLAVCPGPTETKFFQDAEFPQFLANVAAANYTPTEVVVREALIALEKNQSSVVPGAITNQLTANLHRFLPRETLVNLWKNILGFSKGN